MNQERLHELLSEFPTRRIAIVGDFFLDKYLDFDPALAEISIETGKTANQVVYIRHSPGAAGNVAKNMLSLGAGEVIPIGFTGDDGEGYELRQDLKSLGCTTDYMRYVSNRHTPTYLKPQNYMVSGIEGENGRYDTKNREPLPADVEEKIIEHLREVVKSVHAVMIADQVETEAEDCGVITRRVRQALIELSKEYPDTVFWVDSRLRAAKFESMIIKPNVEEAVRAAFPGHTGKIDDILTLKAGEALYKTCGRPIFLTRSEQGIFVFDTDCVHKVRGVSVEGPIDPTGAGDSATAAAVLSLASGASNEESALMANLVGSITVKCLGQTGCARPEQLANRLKIWHSQRPLHLRRRKP